ncbi:MAG: glycoside hydrolase family protein [Cyanobacteria bacterium J06635_1]
MPGSIVKPKFEELSPDLRYRIALHHQRRDWSIAGLCGLLSASILMPVAIPALNTVVETALPIGRIVKEKFKPAIAPVLNQPVQKGENIAGYTVTSGYGWRDTTHLPAGASSNHRGVDLATPNGTPVYAIGDPGTQTKIDCWKDPNGGGLVAEITPESIPGLRFQALHLQNCKTGHYPAGHLIARTGESGLGAPHLDWRQRKQATGSHEHPQQGYLIWALTGHKPYSLSGKALENGIKASEGLRLQAYLDPAGIPTIGWGTTRYPDNHPVQLGDTITRQQAEQYLQHDLSQAQAAVQSTVRVPLRATELHALTSFTYNVGAAALKTSTLAQKLNQGDRKGAAAEFDRWVHSHGVVLPGLVKRRAQEKALFIED